MKKKVWKSAVFLSVALCLVLAGCGKNNEAATTNAKSDGAAAAGEQIKVGILHSLSGTMAISEVSVKDSEMMAIEEINAAGGVLGKTN